MAWLCLAIAGLLIDLDLLISVSSDPLKRGAQGWLRKASYGLKPGEL